MIRKITLLSLLIVGFLSSGVVVSHPFAQARLTGFDDVDAYISSRMKELGIPGAALVIVRDGQVVHLMAFGVADGDGRPVTPQTPFFTGSTGKSFTALAIMQLVEAGRIDLDARVQTYLPWFHVAVPSGRSVGSSTTSRPAVTRAFRVMRSSGIKAFCRVLEEQI